VSGVIGVTQFTHKTAHFFSFSFMLHLEFNNHILSQIILATLSQKAIRIQGIREQESEIGLKDYEINLIRLVEKMTNGTVIRINHTGTSLDYVPGILAGGSVVHDCNGRGIGYFLSLAILLAPFCKKPLNLTLRGITNDNVDITVDSVRTVLLPQLKHFGIDDVELSIKKRGAYPKGGGEVLFTCPIVKQLKPVLHTEKGLVKRIRGIAYCTRMSPQFANRMVESARSILTRYIPDVYIYTDVYKGPESGLCPGYGMNLVAETDTNSLISTECQYQPRLPDGEDFQEEFLSQNYHFPTPEDLGVRCARQLLVELKKSGSVDSMSQFMYLVFMAMTPEDVSKIRVGTLTPYTYLSSNVVSCG
jgi:RNA 3'-terminal phosphate cyclase-like protein